MRNVTFYMLFFLEKKNNTEQKTRDDNSSSLQKCLMNNTIKLQQCVRCTSGNFKI